MIFWQLLKERIENWTNKRLLVIISNILIYRSELFQMIRMLEIQIAISIFFMNQKWHKLQSFFSVNQKRHINYNLRVVYVFFVLWIVMFWNRSDIRMYKFVVFANQSQGLWAISNHHFYFYTFLLLHNFENWNFAWAMKMCLPNVFG